MKIKLFLVLAIMFSLQGQSMASVSVEEALSEDYMRNSGYSRQIYETVSVGRARANGEEFYSRAETEYAKLRGPRKFVRKVFLYFDPARDDFSFYHHDIHPEPSIDDL